MGKPYLPNLEPFIAAGVDPKTGLPIKVSSGCKVNLKDDIKKALRIIDEQDACGRYKWTGLEKLKLTSQELERMLYYKGQLCLFYIKELEQFAILPYALDGTIDMYGRFNTVHPVPFTNGTDEKSNKAVSEYLSTMKLKCLYEAENEPIEDPSDCCVLIHDYTKQLSQTILPRVTINDPILDVMSECIPYMQTRLMLSTGVKGVRVADADQEASVSDGSKRLHSAALRGEAYVPIVGALEFQDLSADKAGKSEEYMLAMQSLDNFRLSTYGIENGGLFEKKAHELQSEQNVNQNCSSLVLQDGLEIRKHFCDVVNKVFGSLGITLGVEVTEQAQQMDNMEGDMEGEVDYEQDDTTI